MAFSLAPSRTITSVPQLPDIGDGLSIDCTGTVECCRLNRIRLRFDQTQDNPESLFFDIRPTGRVVTAAALIVSALLALFVG